MALQDQAVEDRVRSAIEFLDPSEYLLEYGRDYDWRR